MGKRNLIRVYNKGGCKNWLNLDNILMFEHVKIKQKSKGAKTYVNAYILKQADGIGEYVILEVTELEEENYKKIKEYLRD